MNELARKLGEIKERTVAIGLVFNTCRAFLTRKRCIISPENKGVLDALIRISKDINNIFISCKHIDSLSLVNYAASSHVLMFKMWDGGSMR